MTHVFRNRDVTRPVLAGLAVALLIQGLHAGDAFAFTVVALSGVPAAFGAILRIVDVCSKAC